MKKKVYKGNEKCSYEDDYESTQDSGAQMLDILYHSAR